MIPMLGEVSYLMLSLEDATSSRGMQLEVQDIDGFDAEAGPWWSPSWLPIAENTAGDYLVLECGDNSQQGNVLLFSHETREVGVRSKSLLNLMQEIAVGLKTGKYEWSADAGGVC
jgi:cell wall assembly regulator SMI1